MIIIIIITTMAIIIIKIITLIITNNYQMSQDTHGSMDTPLPNILDGFNKGQKNAKDDDYDGVHHR